MSYEEFKTEYVNTFKTMMSYPPNQAGASIYAEKMADLEEAYPAFAEMAENEL